MGDTKISGINPNPAPPAEWDKDDAPAETAKDDPVVANQAHQVNQQEAAPKDRYLAVDQPVAMQQQLVEQVVETTAYRAAQPDDARARRERLLEELKQKKDPDAGKERPRQALSAEADESLVRVLKRVEDLVRELVSVVDSIEKTEEEDKAHAAKAAGDPGAPTDRQVAQANLREERAFALLQRLVRLETQTKYQLQLLLAGGIGLSLAQDPRITFRRLFDRFRRWPKNMRPGHRPETDEEYDDFLAWVFEPPAAPEDDAPLAF